VLKLGNTYQQTSLDSRKYRVLSTEILFCHPVIIKYGVPRIAHQSHAGILLNRILNSITIRWSTFEFSSSIFFSSIVVRNERLILFCSNTSLGCGENVMTTDSHFESLARLTRQLRRAICPRCTPSKIPRVATGAIRLRFS